MNVRACTHKKHAELSLWQQFSEPHFPSPELIYQHTFSIHATHLSCLQLIMQFCSSFCFAFYVSLLFSASFSLIVSQPCGLPAITPPVHQHRGQEGGMYADIWTVIPTVHMACQCPAGSSLQYGTHTGFKDTHPSRMARKLDWHLNNRITGAYGLSVNTVGA